MHYADRVTVCVSTQAGCAMACQFCATGQAGFQRHLTQGEIVEQVAVAMREAAPRRLSNVVFMGMGEPLANYDRVWAAVDAPARRDGPLGAAPHALDGRASCPASAAWPARPSRSTSPSPCTPPTTTLRDELVPINRRYPLADAHRGLCRLRGGQRPPPLHRVGPHRRRQRPARATPRSWRRSPGRWAPTSTSSRSTPRPATRWSAPRHRPRAALPGPLVALGVNATVRVTRGAEIDAACGQLAARRRRTRPRPGPVAWRPCSLERAHDTTKRSGVVRPSVLWFLLLDGGIVVLTKLAFSKSAYDKVTITGDALPPRSPSSLLVGTAAIHVTEAPVAGRIAERRGLPARGWRRQTFVVGFPSLLALRRAAPRSEGGSAGAEPIPRPRASLLLSSRSTGGRAEVVASNLVTAS